MYRHRHAHTHTHTVETQALGLGINWLDFQRTRSSPLHGGIATSPFTLGVQGWLARLDLDISPTAAH